MCLRRFGVVKYFLLLSVWSMPSISFSYDESSHVRSRDGSCVLPFFNLLFLYDTFPLFETASFFIFVLLSPNLVSLKGMEIYHRLQTSLFFFRFADLMSFFIFHFSTYVSLCLGLSSL